MEIDMKKILGLFIVCFLLSSSLFAGVVKKTKTNVTFGTFGTFSALLTDKIAIDKKKTESEIAFQGKGLGGLVMKAFFKQGEIGEIIDLSTQTIYDLDHKKKTYVQRELEKMKAGEEGTVSPYQQEGIEETESPIRIIRSEFSVDKTGETKTINNFPCEKFAVSWITEWENIESGQKGMDRLLTDVWTTPSTEKIIQAQQEELNFSKELMLRLGFEYSEVEQDILGTTWMAMFGQMDQQSSSPQKSSADFSEELRKIEGYPVIIDGKFYSKKEGGEKVAGQEEEGTNVRKMLGNLAKKTLSKKSEASPDEPSFAYYTELLAFSPESVGSEEFHPPAGYKLKEK
ncbi:MAG: hypothetical protein MUP98_18925, partial [Candidatus Aminicenantes bacterium]|nr:hypothetical protein [Candidatus Aminicenantes bacterium]